MEAARSRVALAAERTSGRGNPLLRLASDERLVARVRAGSEPAFAELYERYYRKILSFCRHMLGSQEEGEDAVQQTFINAYRDMSRSDKELHFRPWLYRIARNQSLSMLRARRAQVELSEAQPSLVGLSDEVAGRGDLRDLLHDLGQLPTEQREALVLAELHDNSHAEVAEIVGCDKEKVKSLVFQARSSLIKSRQAREVSCEDIRRQLGILRGGSLRRNVIRRHLKECEGCRAFHHDVKRQRQALAIILPVIPSAALKLGAATAMAAVGAKAAGAAAGGAVAGGATAGGATAAGATAGGATAAGAGTGAGAAAGGATVGGAAAASGPFAAAAAKLGVSAVAVKGAVAAATVTAVVAGGTVGENVTRDLIRDKKPPVSQSPAKGEKGTAGKGGQGPGMGAAGAPGAASGKKEEGAKSDRAKRSRRARRGSRRRRNGEDAGRRRAGRVRGRRRDRRRRAHDPRDGQDRGGVERPAPPRPPSTSPPTKPPSGSPRERPDNGTIPTPRTRSPKPGGDGLTRGRRRRKATSRKRAGKRPNRRRGARRRGKNRGEKPPAKAGSSMSVNGGSTQSTSRGH